MYVVHICNGWFFVCKNLNTANYIIREQKLKRLVADKYSCSQDDDYFLERVRNDYYYVGA